MVFSRNMLLLHLLGTAFLFAAGTGSTLTSGDCPVWLPRDIYLQVFGDKCYYFYITKYGEFTPAQHYCKNRDGNLAMIKSRKVNDYIVNQLRRTYSFTGSAWIGLHDEDEEGKFIWVDGTPMFYDNFADNEGNNRGSSWFDFNSYNVEDCVAIDAKTAKGEWRDYRCRSSLYGFVNEKKSFICEFHVVPRPTTTTTTTTKMPTTRSSSTPTPHSNIATAAVAIATTTPSRGNFSRPTPRPSHKAAASSTIKFTQPSHVPKTKSRQPPKTSSGITATHTLTVQSTKMNNTQSTHLLKSKQPAHSESKPKSTTGIPTKLAHPRETLPTAGITTLTIQSTKPSTTLFTSLPTSRQPKTTTGVSTAASSTTTNIPTPTTTTTTTTTTSAPVTCENINCDLDCGLSGYRLDAAGCLKCECEE